MMDTYYIDGEFVPEDRATMPVNDLTVLRGYGIFDYLITYNKRPFYLEEHVARLENSAAEIGLKMQHSHSEICDIVMETIKRNTHHTESSIRVVYTGGISPDGVTPQGNGILMVLATPKYEIPDWWYEKGASIITVHMERYFPTLKSTNYLNAIFAQQQAKKRRAVEAVYVDHQNRVLEGTTANFFAVKNNTVITPPDNILPGITRDVILKLLEDAYPLELKHIDKEELPGFDEIFITSSNKEVVPIVKIDDIEVSQGKPGTCTRHIMELFRAFTTQYGQMEAAP